MANTRRSICAAEALALAARRTPSAPALVLGDEIFDYSAAATWLERLTEVLDCDTLRSARLVGVAHSNPVLHLFILFALESLGVATLPFVQPADSGIEMALAHCDLLLAEVPLERLRAPTMLLSTEWLERVRASPGRPIRVAPVDEHAMVNVFTTSGSSGAAKGIVFDSLALDARIRGRLWQYGLDSSARVVAGMPVSTSSTYFVAQAVLRVGAALVFPSSSEPLRGLEHWTHAIILPVHLARLAESAGVGGPTSVFKVFVVGARLPEAVRVLARERLGALTVEAYGTTETGWLALMDQHHIGDVLPEVDVEVVDHNDLPVPQGESGEVRARSPEMAQRYLDGALSQRQFRDGWYYTGDLGRMHATRRLELLGRADAMLNFGGLKISAEAIEEMLSHHQLADDLAAASRKGMQGIESLVIFLKGPRLASEALITRVSSLFGANLGRIELRVVTMLPRAANGKLQRAELQLMAETQAS